MLRHKDLVLFPLLPEEQEDLDEDRYLPTSESGVAPVGPAVPVLTAPAGVVLTAVPTPGHGDDVGTLTVCVDGFPHFASYSGGLESWLTEEPRSCGWVC